MRNPLLLFVELGYRHTQGPGQEGNLVIPDRTLARFNLGNAGLVQGVSGDRDPGLEGLLGQSSRHAQGPNTESDLVASPSGHSVQGRTGGGAPLIGDPGGSELSHTSFMLARAYFGYAVAEYSIATYLCDY